MRAANFCDFADSLCEDPDAAHRATATRDRHFCCRYLLIVQNRLRRRSVQFHFVIQFLNERSLLFQRF